MLDNLVVTYFLGHPVRVFIISKFQQ